MPAPDRLTWIHVSDLHFGHGRDATEDFDQQAVVAALLRDVKLVAAELGAPDYVFVTGDIAFSAGKEQYSATARWLDQLLGLLSLDRSRVLLVPGNHDVERKAAGDFSRPAYHGYRAKPSLVNEALKSAPEMKALWTKHEAYQAFARSFGSPEITPDSPFWIHALTGPGAPVVAIGLNTTLLSFDRSDSPTTLALGEGQIHRALQSQPPDALLLVLQHHPPSWLVDGKTLAAELERFAHVLFCGHVHDDTGLVHLPIGSPGHVQLIAGAGHAEANEKGDHGYAWGRIHRDGLDYLPRVWSDRYRQMSAQRLHPSSEGKRWSASTGEYVSFPAARLPVPLQHWLARLPAPADAAASVDGKAFFSTSATSADSPLDPAHLPSLDVLPDAARWDPSRAYFHVPHTSKGRQVVGREEALWKVRAQLARGLRTAIGQTAAFVGFGGLGKTQLAVEYAHAHRDDYPRGVFWLNADEDIDGQLGRIADVATWVSPASDAKSKLEIALHQIRSRSDCLLIFDNVEDLAKIEPYLPEPPAAPHILITSRTPHDGFAEVPIEQLDVAQSLQMLVLESGRALDADEDREAAARIVTQLEGLPLALELVGAYLRRRPAVRLPDYAALLDQQGVEARGLSDGKLRSFTKHDANLRAALQIEESVFDEAPLMRRVVDLFAWSGSASMGRAFLGALLGEDDVTGIDVALGEAVSLKILKRESGAGEARYQMHRLVRGVRQQDVPLEAGRAAWLEVLTRLGEWFMARRREFANLTAFEAEADHLATWCANAETLGEVEAMVRLSWLQAYPPFHRGQYQIAEQRVGRGLVCFEQEHLESWPLKAQLCEDYGALLTLLGNASRARRFAEEGLRLRRANLGELHVDTAASLHSVGSILSVLGEEREGLRLLWGAVRMLRKIPDVGAAHLAVTLSSVGRACCDLRKFRRAEVCLNRALNIALARCGEYHPTVASVLDDLARFESARGRCEPALELSRRALRTRRKVLGDLFPHNGGSLHNMAECLRKLGRIKEAAACAKDAIVIYAETLGPASRPTLESRVLAATLLLELRQPHAAKATVDAGLNASPSNSELRRLRDQIRGKRAPAERALAPARRKPKPARKPKK